MNPPTKSEISQKRQNFKRKTKKKFYEKIIDGGMKYLGRIYYEQKGLINLDDIVDIFIEVGNIHNYLENAALRILLFGKENGWVESFMKSKATTGVKV